MHNIGSVTSIAAALILASCSSDDDNDVVVDSMTPADLADSVYPPTR